jgi:hypothetical protein
MFDLILALFRGTIFRYLAPVVVSCQQFDLGALRIYCEMGIRSFDIFERTIRLGPQRGFLAAELFLTF